MDENENVSHQNLWAAANTVPRREFITIYDYTGKEEIPYQKTKL